MCFLNFSYNLSNSSIYKFLLLLFFMHREILEARLREVGRDIRSMEEDCLGEKSEISFKLYRELLLERDGLRAELYSETSFYN